MPELPELEVVREVLQRRVVGCSINAVQVIPPGGPIVARDLANVGFEDGLLGVTIVDVTRRASSWSSPSVPERRRCSWRSTPS